MSTGRKISKFPGASLPLSGDETIDLIQAGINKKAKVSDLPSSTHFLGKYTTLTALQAAHPTAAAGDYAQVDAGAGIAVINYNYDIEDGWVIGGGGGSGATTTDELPEGATNKYFTNTRAIAAVDISGKVDKVSGKQLSTEDYSTTEKSKLLGIAAGAQVNDANTTLQGNTFNGGSQLIKTTAASKYPALDGSLITNLPTGTAGIYAGTGAAFTSYAVGDLIYASAINILSKLAAGTNGQVLILASGVPAWGNTSIDTAANLTWTGKHTFNNSVTAVANVAQALVVSPTLIAITNADVMSALTISPIFSGTTPEPTTGGGGYGLIVNAKSLFNGDVVLNSNVLRLTTFSNPTHKIYFDGTNNVWMYAEGTSIVFKTNSGSGQYSFGVGGFTTAGLHVTAATEISGAIAMHNYQFGIDANGIGNGNFIVGTTNFVGIGQPSAIASARLVITSTTQGVLLPRMTTTQRDAISSPAEGLIIYNTTTHKLNLFTTAWEQVTSA